MNNSFSPTILIPGYRFWQPCFFCTVCQELYLGEPLRLQPLHKITWFCKATVGEVSFYAQCLRCPRTVWSLLSEQMQHYMSVCNKKPDILVYRCIFSTRERGALLMHIFRFFWDSVWTGTVQSREMPPSSSKSITSSTPPNQTRGLANSLGLLYP